MLDIALTYYAVGRTAPMILPAAIAAYLFTFRRREPATLWLGAFFALLGLWNLSYIIVYSINYPSAGYAWNLACAIAFAAVARLQIA